MKQMLRLLMSMMIIFMVGSSLHAADFTKNNITVSTPWSRATIPSAKVVGGYLTIKNTGNEADKLVSITSDVSDKVEIHEMSMEGDVMKMRKVDGINISAQSEVTLKPGGFHVMFVGIKAPLKKGTDFSAVLHFEKNGDVKVTFNVEAMAAKAPSKGADKDYHEHGNHTGHSK